MRILLYCAIAAMLAGVPLFAGEPLFPIYAGGHFGFMGKTGKIVIEPKFIRVGRFSEGLAVVGVGYPDKTRYAFIDETGVMAIAPQFSGAEPFSGGLAAVETGGRIVQEGQAWVGYSGKWGYIDHSGKLVIPQEFDSAGSFFGDVRKFVEN